MARYDVHRQRNGEPLLNVQADLFADLNTRIVVPLMPRVIAPKPAHRLNHRFEIESVQLVMVTQYMAAMTASELGPTVANLDDRHDDILAALDMLFLGL